MTWDHHPLAGMLRRVADWIDGRERYAVHSPTFLRFCHKCGNRDQTNFNAHCFGAGQPVHVVCLCCGAEWRERRVEDT